MKLIKVRLLVRHVGLAWSAKKIGRVTSQPVFTSSKKIKIKIDLNWVFSFEFRFYIYLALFGFFFFFLGGEKKLCQDLIAHIIVHVRSTWDKFVKKPITLAHIFSFPLKAFTVMLSYCYIAIFNNQHHKNRAILVVLLLNFLAIELW